MDTLKSYFNKMKLLPGHSHKSWKFTRKGSLGKSGPKAKYSRSKSQNDAAYEASMGTGTDFTDGKENSYSRTGTLIAKDSTRESNRCAPVKPPRKDHVFSVEFEICSNDSLGVILDKSRKSPSTCGGSDMDWNSVSQNGDTYDDLTDEEAYRTLSAVKVVDIQDGSLVQTDGRVQLYDELMEVNNRSVRGEAVEGVRRLLDQAIRSGRVIMTLRRKRNRPIQTPPTPTRAPTAPFTSLSSSNLTEPSTTNGLAANGHVTKSDLCLESDCYRSYNNSLNLNSLNCSENSLTESNDDVFTNSMSDVQFLPKSHPCLNDVAESHQKKRAIYEHGRSELFVFDKQRTHSESAVQDFQVENGSQRPNRDYVNTAELARRNNYGVLSPVLNSNIDSDMYQSDTEVQVCTRLYKQRKVARTPDLYRQNNNSTPTSLCSFDDGSDYDFSCHSSPGIGKRRMIGKMHLLKESNSLGLHIAGGRGSKRGDIGIYVAGLTEYGPAHRDGRLKRGDELLMINGRSLIGVSHVDAVDILRNAPKLVQLVVAAKVRKSSSLASTISNFSSVTSPLSPDPTGSQCIPEVMAQTPQGTIVNWEELFDKFSPVGLQDKPPSGPSSLTGSRYTKRQQSGTRQLPPVTISVNKGVRGKGLGFTIVGGADTAISHMGVIVRRIFQRGLIAEDGRIREGDEILELNGETLAGLKHKEVTGRFRQLKKGPVTITFRRRLKSPQCSPGRSPYLTPATSCDGSPVSTPGHSPHGSLSDLRDPDLTAVTTAMYDHVTHNHRPTFSVPVSIPRNVAGAAPNTPLVERLSPDNKPKIQQEIQLLKDCGVGLGISVIRKTYDGVSEILVQDISHGSPAQKDGRLRKGDLIVEVNGRSMTNMTLLDAYQLFRNLPSGPVGLVIRRKDSIQMIELIVRTTTPDVHEHGSPSTNTSESDVPCSPSVSLEDLDHVTSLQREDAEHVEEVVKDPLRKRLSTVSEENGSLV